VRKVIDERGVIRTSKMERHVNLVRKLLRSDHDWWGINEGYEGSGKSTGSIWSGHHTARDLFRYDQHIVYEPLELLRLIDDAPQYGVIILDEAGEALFNREFNKEMNIAIIKASQSCRDRNLHIQYNVPGIELLDSKIFRRFRELVKYEEMNWQRGYSLWHQPMRKRYDGKAMPWWDAFLEYHFLDLPAVKRDAYKKIKTERGKERLAGYIEKLERTEEKAIDVDPLKIIERIRKDPDKDKYLSSKGTWSRDAIRFHCGVPEGVARQVQVGLKCPVKAEE
jgi:hypothetical protein